jgi:hypothetical protein
MGGTVNFDNQIQSVAIEIYNIWAEWFLAVEPVSAHLPASQMLPKQDFAQSAVFSQVLAVLF